jgi:hypothetical protein
MKTALVTLLIASLSPTAQIAPQRWAEAEREIRRLAPAAFRDLPAPVAAYLRQHGYTIPQVYDTPRPHNVVTGRFDADAAPDWAVLASRGGTSRVLVFWGGSAARVTTLAPRRDADYLQTTSEDTIGYSRGISVVGRQYIVEHHRRYGGPALPPIRHDAIEDGFAGKASVVYYFDGQRWRELQGAD